METPPFCLHMTNCSFQTTIAKSTAGSEQDGSVGELLADLITK